MSYIFDDIHAAHVAKNGRRLSRDEFAAAALQGMLTRPSSYGSSAAIVILAYGYAEAMLAEREKREAADPK